MVLLLEDLSERHSGHRNVLKEQVWKDATAWLCHAKVFLSLFLEDAGRFSFASDLPKQVQHALEILDPDGHGVVTEGEFVEYFVGRPLSSIAVFGTQHSDGPHARHKRVSRAAELGFEGRRR